MAEPRRIINFRLSENGHVWFSDLAVEYEVDKTAVFRAALAVARRHEAELRLILREGKNS